MTEHEIADGIMDAHEVIDWRESSLFCEQRDAIATAIRSAREAGMREGAEARERVADDDPRWIMDGALAPTWDEVKCAGLAWCNSLERETFLSDETYFRNTWTALPGLKLYVAREVAKRVALSEARTAAILSLSPSPTGGLVAVKPLEWRGPYGTTSSAGTIIGGYEVWKHPRNDSWVMQKGFSDTFHPTEEAAKAAAQADYEARIRSALVLPAPPADGDARSAGDEPPVDDGPAPPFGFDRYINGRLMAEGVVISREPTLERATLAAVKIAPRAPGDALVLVYRGPDAARSAGIGGSDV